MKRQFRLGLALAAGLLVPSIATGILLMQATSSFLCLVSDPVTFLVQILR